MERAIEQKSIINDNEKRRESMTFDHVALHPDQQIGQHSQQTWELSYIIQGSGESLIGSIREPFHHAMPH